MCCALKPNDAQAAPNDDARIAPANEETAEERDHDEADRADR